MVLTIGSTVIDGIDSIVRSDTAINFFTAVLLSLLFNILYCLHNIIFPIDPLSLFLLFPKAKNPITRFMRRGLEIIFHFSIGEGLQDISKSICWLYNNHVHEKVKRLSLNIENPA